MKEIHFTDIRPPPEKNPKQNKKTRENCAFIQQIIRQLYNNDCI